MLTRSLPHERRALSVFSQSRPESRPQLDDEDPRLVLLRRPDMFGVNLASPRTGHSTQGLPFRNSTQGLPPSHSASEQRNSSPCPDPVACRGKSPAAAPRSLTHQSLGHTSMGVCACVCVCMCVCALCACALCVSVCALCVCVYAALNCLPRRDKKMFSLYRLTRSPRTHLVLGRRGRLQQLPSSPCLFTLQS